jgi:hypothetical protein
MTFWVRRMLSSTAALGLLAPALILEADARAQTAGAVSAPVDVTRLGPQVGEKVPDFTLTDQQASRARWRP